MASAIPGLDVTELPNDRASLRQFVQDPGPGNPNVGPQGSKQAQGLRTAPVQEALAAEARTAANAAKPPGVIGKTASGLRTVAGGAQRVLGPAAIVATAADAASSLGTAYTEKNPVRADDAPGVGFDPMSGLSYGGGTTNDQAMENAAKVEARPKWTGVFGSDKPAAVAAPAPAVTTATPVPAAAGLRGPVLPNPNAANPWQDPAKRGFTRGTVSEMSVMSPEVQAINERASGIQAQSRAVQRELDGFGAGAHNADGTGGMADLGGRGPLVTASNAADFEQARRQEILERGLKSIDKGVRATAMQGIAQGNPGGDALKIAGLREQGDSYRAAAANASNRAIHRDSNAVAMRGQDVTDRGHRMANEVATATARRDQGNKDRQYQLDVAKYGTEIADKNLAVSQAAEKSHQTRLENTFRTTDAKGENIPDHAKIAAYNTSVDTTLPLLIDALRKSGSPQALAKASELQQRGQAALGPDDHAEMQKLFQTREQLRASRSMLPGGAEFSDSDNLLNFRQAQGAAGVDIRAMTPNRVKFAGGSSATVNDLSIPGGANAVLPDIGAVRNDNLTRGLRRPE